MLKVGITGGIGTGKSTVAKVFKVLGVPVYEADSRANFLIENNNTVVDAIKKLLGQEAYTTNGKYNRKYVAQKVFENETLLKALNKIVHPAVGNDFEEWEAQQNSAPYVLKEAALMSKNSGMDKIIVVSSPLDLRISRIKKRDNRTAEQIEQIVANQKTESEFLAIADFVIENNEYDFLLPQILKIHQQLVDM